MTLFHGWESGTDNSPRWDAPYAGVEVGPGLPLYQRKDKAHVSDACQRPTDREYDRYLWLVEEAKRASYDAGLLRQTGSFQVGDVLFTAIFACASDLLAPWRCGCENPTTPPSSRTTPPRLGRLFSATSTRRRAWPPTLTCGPGRG